MSLAHEHLAVADADDERAVRLGDDDLVGRVAREHRDRVCPAHLQEGCSHRVDETTRPGGQGLLDEVRDHLRVGVAREADSLGLELAPEGDVILDDAVVHDGDPTGDVRMRVRLAGPAVRGPAGVPDAGASHERVLLQRRLEVGELADRAHDFDAHAA